jgi:hypothetical protein
MRPLQQRVDEPPARTGKTDSIASVMGNAATLDPTAQGVLAAWIAMCAMTSDFFYPERQAIRQGDRDWLRDNLSPPPETRKIWIGNYARGDWPAHYVKNSMAISDEGLNPEIGADGIPRPNTQTTTIVFGHLYVHVFSSVFSHLAQGVWGRTDDFGKIVEVWPVREQPVAWPAGLLTDRNADNIAAALFQTLDAASRASA